MCEVRAVRLCSRSDYVVAQSAFSVTGLIITHWASGVVNTKYRKGPQQTARDHTYDMSNTARDHSDTRLGRQDLQPARQSRPRHLWTREFLFESPVSSSLTGVSECVGFNVPLNT